MRNERVFRVGVREEEPASGFVIILILVVILAAVLGVLAAYKVDLSSIPFGTNRQTGTEVYDSAIDGWRYKDNSGEFVHNAEVYLADDDKWVRYDEHGYMIKGWYTNEQGTYYYDLTTGAMLKGAYVIDGLPYYFDDVTGVLR